MASIISTGATLPSLGQDEPGFQLVEADITFLKDSRQVMKIMPRNGDTQPVNIHCYYDVAMLRNAFNFHANGFQFYALDPYLVVALHQFDPCSNKKRLGLLSQATRYVYAWGKENGIEGIAMPINLTYRNTNPKANATPAFFFAHVDYDENDLANTLQTNKRGWKANIESITGPLSDEVYQSLKINAMVNLWMPLNKNPTKNTLALVDTSSIENLSEQLRPALTPGQEGLVTSLGLLPHEKQKWVVQTVMRRGDGVLFNTLKTPHAAVDIEDRFQGQLCDLDPDRESVEIRWIFI